MALQSHKGIRWTLPTHSQKCGKMWEFWARRIQTYPMYLFLKNSAKLLLQHGLCHVCHICLYFTRGWWPLTSVALKTVEHQESCLDDEPQTADVRFWDTLHLLFDSKFSSEYKLQSWDYKGWALKSLASSFMCLIDKLKTWLFSGVQTENAAHCLWQMLVEAASSFPAAHSMK